jgi:hypothetical protein
MDTNFAERQCSPTHGCEPINNEIRTEDTEPNVLGVASCSASDLSWWQRFKNWYERFERWFLGDIHELWVWNKETKKWDRTLHDYSKPFPNVADREDE